MSACKKSSSREGPKLLDIAPDVLYEILSRLDGISLAAVSCVSSQFRSLCKDDKLWQNLCNSTWPSTAHPDVSSAISSFPSAHRAFFSDSLPSLVRFSKDISDIDPVEKDYELIFAVDVYYQNKAVHSEVMQLTTSGFQELYYTTEDKDERLFPLPPTFELNENGRANAAPCREVERNLSVSWIMIDPVKKRAVNLVRHRPVRKGFPYWSVEDDEIRLVLPAYVSTVPDGSGKMMLFVVMVECVLRGQKLYVRKMTLCLTNGGGSIDSCYFSSRSTDLGLVLAALDGQRRRNAGQESVCKELGRRERGGIGNYFFRQLMYVIKPPLLP